MHGLVDAFIKGRDKFPKRTISKYFDNEKNPKACCHVGAVFYGLFKKSQPLSSTLTKEGSIFFDIVQEYDDFRKLVPMPCDDTEETEGWIGTILIHLNDDHTKKDWPDEKVSGWLEQALA